MKKILSFLFVIVLSLCMAIAATAASGKDLSSILDGIDLGSLTDSELAEILKGLGLDGDDIDNTISSLRNEKGFEYAVMSSTGNSEIAIYGFDADVLGTDVVIPETIHGIKVTHIYGGGVFGWKKLTSVTIPDSVTNIGKGAFDGSVWYNSQPNGDVYAGKFYYKYKGTMPNNTSISIKDGTKGIVGAAFDDCTGLTSVTIPDSVTSIGSSAFENCTGLTEINWNAENVQDFGGSGGLVFSNAGTSGDGIDVVFGENVKHIPSYLFYEDVDFAEDFKTPKIKTVIIGNSVTSIGDATFMGCSELTSIIIPDSVTSIGDEAFSDCVGLTSITIGNSLTNIYYSAFRNCTKLENINWNAENVKNLGSGSVFLRAGIYGDGIDVVFGDNVKHIPAYLFSETPKIKAVTISDNVTSIGSNAFDGTMWYNSQPDGDVYAGKVYYKYKGTMPSNTSITIKDGTKGIASSALIDCTGLTSITIPNSVTNIGEYSFYGCKGLINVTIPKNVRTIGESAFRSCSGIKTMTFESKLIRIGNHALGYDENLIPYEDFTIKGYEHSSAEVYALINGFDFVSLDKEEHVHYYTVKTYVQPTCLSIGYEVHACYCGDTYSVTLPALGHTDEDNDGICDRCEEKLVNKEEHVHYYTVKTYVQPTCLSIGYEVRACSCGDTYSVTLPALGHTDEDNNGICDRCEEKLAAQPEEPTQPDTPSDDKNDDDNAFVAFFKQIIELLKKLFNLLGKRA